MPTSTRGHTSPGGRDRTAMRGICAAAVAAVALILGGCGSEPPAAPESPSAPGSSAAPEPSGAAGLPDASLLTQPSQVVGSDEWGVVQASQAVGSAVGVVAVKITSITKGEPGELKDATTTSGNGQVLDTGVPFFINYHWSVLTGEGWLDPGRGIWAWNDSAEVAALQVGAPSLTKCPEAASVEGGGPQLELVGCVVALFEDPALTVDQIRYSETGRPDSDTAIRFEVPATS